MLSGGRESTCAENGESVCRENSDARALLPKLKRRGARTRVKRAYSIRVWRHTFRIALTRRSAEDETMTKRCPYFCDFGQCAVVLFGLVLALVLGCGGGIAPGDTNDAGLVVTSRPTPS